jgi:hypothetical protein
VALGVADHPYLSAVTVDDGAFRNCRRRVIGSFAVHFGVQRLEDPRDRAPSEEQHAIDAAHGRDQGRAVPGRHQGPSWSAQRARRGIVVQRDQEMVALAPRRRQVTQVADMQEIEKPVGEDEPGARVRAPERPAPAQRLGEPDDWRRGARPGHDATIRPAGSGSLVIAARSSAGVTVAVPRFMTTIPPA